MRIVHALGWPVLALGISIPIPSGKQGVCWGLVIFMRDPHDEFWLAHELVHSEQCIRGWFIPHAIHWLLSKGFRLDCEVEAFRAQLALLAPPDREVMVERFARALAGSYGFDVTVGEALDLLGS